MTIELDAGGLDVAAGEPATPAGDLFGQKVDIVLKAVGDLLKAKNASYGDAALTPLRIFSKADSVEQIKVRIDDKLSRLQRGGEFGTEDTLLDLIGYLVLLRIAKASENA